MVTIEITYRLLSALLITTVSYSVDTAKEDVVCKIKIAPRALMTWNISCIPLGRKLFHSSILKIYHYTSKHNININLPRRPARYDKLIKTALYPAALLDKGRKDTIVNQEVIGNLDCTAGCYGTGCSRHYGFAMFLQLLLHYHCCCCISYCY